MPDEDLFQMTVVIQERRPRSKENANGNAEKRADPRHVRSHNHQDSGSRHGGHDNRAHGRSERDPNARAHRRYNDYGTVDLGTLDVRQTAEESVPVPEEPSNGALQREFLDKYNTVLSRRYATRNKSKLPRLLLIAALMALIAVLVFVGIGSLNKEEEVMPKPSLETIPVETLDLG